MTACINGHKYVVKLEKQVYWAKNFPKVLKLHYFTLMGGLVT